MFGGVELAGCSSLFDEIVATDELLQTVIVRVFLEVIAQFLSLLLENLWHLFVNLLEQLVDLGQELACSGLQCVAYLVKRVLTKCLSAFLVNQASLGQIALHSLDWTGE